MGFFLQGEGRRPTYPLTEDDPHGRTDPRHLLCRRRPLESYSPCGRLATKDARCRSYHHGLGGHVILSGKLRICPDAPGRTSVYPTYAQSQSLEPSTASPERALRDFVWTVRTAGETSQYRIDLYHRQFSNPCM